MDRFPLSGAFELTARCNLRCKMCFVRVDDQRIRELGARELTREEWIGLARQAADMGTMNLLLTGGEPLLRPDFAEIYEAIAGMGFYLTLYTNATLLSPDIKRLLTKYPPHRIGVTLYGASPETYLNTCGDASGYDRTLEGIRFLSGLPSKLDIRTTFIKDNVGDLDKIRAYVASLGDGIGYAISNVVSQAVRGGTSDAAASRLCPRDQVKLYIDATVHAVKEMSDPPRRAAAEQKLASARRDAELLSVSRHGTEFPQEREERTSLFGCAAGVDRYTITWDGRLIGCQTMNSRGTDARDGGLQGAWDAYPDTVHLPSPSPVCRACTMKGDCVACPATRLAESGSLTGVPEYNCRIAALASRTSLQEIAGYCQQ